MSSFVKKLNNPDLGLLFIRLGLAAIFIFHGWQKINGLAGTVSFFESVGIPGVFAYVVAVAEVAVGVAMLLGAYVRYAGLVITVIMAVAIMVVKYQKGFGGGGYEFDLMLLLAGLGIAFLGSGRFALMKNS